MLRKRPSKLLENRFFLLKKAILYQSLLTILSLNLIGFQHNVLSND